MVLSVGTPLLNLNLVKITACLEIQGGHCKAERGPQIVTGDPGILTVTTALKVHFNP